VYAKFKTALAASNDAEAKPSPSEANLSLLAIPTHHASDVFASDGKPEHPRHSTTSRLPLLSSQQSPSPIVAGQPRKVNLKDKLRLLKGPSCRALSAEDSPPEGYYAEEASADPHPIRTKPDQATGTFQQGAPSTSAEDILAETRGDFPLKRRHHTPASAAGANPRSRVHTGRWLAQLCTASYLVKGVC